MKLINIGYGNLISSERMISVVSPDAAPIKRMVQDAKDKGTLIDASCGRICSYFVDLLDAGRTSCPSISPIIVIKCILPCFLLFSSTTCPKS